MKLYMQFYKQLHYFVILTFFVLIAFFACCKAQAHVVDIHVPTPEDIARELEGRRIPEPGRDFS